MIYTVNGAINQYSALDNIVSIRCSLNRDYNFIFGLFDIAYVFYCNLCGKVIEERNKASLLDNELMNKVLPFLQLSKFAVIADVLEAIKPFENKWFSSVTETDLSFLKMSPDDIEDVLIQLFVKDFKNNLKKISDPIIICLDNIVRINSDLRECFFNDNGIICNLPCVVWAIASNEEIKDEAVEEKYIRNVRLEELDYDSVGQYLKENAIKTEYTTNVYEVSGGIPIYVELLVKKILQNETDRVFDLSEKDKNQWIEDYYLTISDDKKKTLKVLAINNTWNEEELITVLSNIKIDKSEYEYVLNQSYVQSFNEKVALHQVIKDVVQTNMSDTEYTNIISKIGSLGLNRDDLYLLNYSKQLYFEPDEQSLIKLIANEYGNSLRTNNCERIIALHQRTAEFLKYKPSFCLMSSYCFVGEMYKNIGLFKKMKETMAVACEMLAEIECPTGFNKTYYEDLCLHALEQYAFALQNEQDLEKSIKIREEILVRTIKAKGSKTIHALNAQQNLYNSLVDMGICDDEIEGRLKHLIKSREKILLRNRYEISKNKEFTVMAKQLLCRVYASRGTENNKELVSNIIELMESANVLPQNCTARNAVDMFIVKIAMDFSLYDVALIEDLKQRVENIYSKDSNVVESINYSLAVAYGETGNPEKGALILQHLYTNSFDKRGISSKETLRYKKEYAICISQIGDHDRALSLLKECKEVYENVYGKDESTQYNNIIHSIDTEEIFVNNTI